MTKRTAKSCSALTADTQVTCQIPSKQVPVPEPKRVSQPTHAHMCPVCVLVVTGVSTVYCPISLRLLRQRTAHAE